MNNNQYLRYLSSLGDFIKDEVEDAKKYNKENTAFNHGYRLALCEFINLMIEKAKHHNIPLPEISLDNLDLAKELL